MEVIAVAGSVDEGIKIINDHSPDILFLDIKMHGETGFDLLDRLNNAEFSLIFTTAFDEFALKAFKFNAVDYLLKPINIEELKNAVNKVLHNGIGHKAKQIESLLNDISNTNARIDKIALPTSEGLIFIETDDIVRCESSDNYTMFYFTNHQKTIVSKTIKYFDELLREHNFQRVHQSHLINLKHVKKYFKGDGGYILMSDGSTVLISRRKKEAFFNKFNNRI